MTLQTIESPWYNEIKYNEGSNCRGCRVPSAEKSRRWPSRAVLPHTKRSPDYVFCIGACSLWQAPADRGDLSAPFSDDPFHQREGACRISGGHPRRVPALCAQSGKAPAQGDRPAGRHEARGAADGRELSVPDGRRRLEGQPDKHLPCAGHAGLYDVGGFCPEARRGAGTVRRHLSPGVF